MDHLQPGNPLPNLPKSDPQPQNTREEGNSDMHKEISSPGNDTNSQHQFQPPPPPSPPQHVPQPSPYPPPNGDNYPPHPSQYPPPSSQSEFSKMATYENPPPSNNFPPPTPLAAGDQQYPPPPPPPYNSLAPGYPVQMQPPVLLGNTVPWTSGIFDCMQDPFNAVVTTFFPCVTFGQIVEVTDGGNISCMMSGLIYTGIAFFVGVPCIVSCFYRTKLRNKYNLMEGPGPDWITHLICEWCALCQEYRELKARGLDPDLGWQGNLMKLQNQQTQVAMMPPTHQTMTG